MQIINPINYENWDSMLVDLPGATIFHTSAWARTLSESYQYTPTYFTLFDGGKIAALIPFMDVNSWLTGHRGISLPFTDYCYPISSTEIDFSGMFESIVAHGKKSGWKYLELRGGSTSFLDPRSSNLGSPTNSTNQPINQFNGCCCSNQLNQSNQCNCSVPSSPSTFHLPPSTSFHGHILDLSPGEKTVYSNLRDSTRRNIKKAISEGVGVKVLNSLEAIKEFYKLNCITRKEHGLPPQPFHFFKKIYEHIVSKNLGFVALAYYKHKAIAGNVYFHFGDKAVYKYGASDKQYQHLRANNLLMWEAIKWYCENGFTILCLGRTDLDHHGLRQFKTGWGTVEHTINYYKYDLTRNAFVSNNHKVSKFSHTVFSKMPISALQLIGSFLYRHVG